MPTATMAAPAMILDQALGALLIQSTPAAITTRPAIMLIKVDLVFSAKAKNTPAIISKAYNYLPPIMSARRLDERRRAIILLTI